MIEITLPILFNPDGSEELTKLGLAVAEYEEKPMTFYIITALHEYREDDHFWTKIFTPGDSFICPMAPGEVMAIINKSLRIKIRT